MPPKENTEWFEKWFDSDHYHLLYGQRDEAEAERFTAALLQLLKPAKGCRVLDMACGRGRHSLSLHKKGLQVTGIDLSERSVAFAKASEKQGLEFFVHDMRKAFRTNYYDIVLNLFTSMGYFEKEKDDQDLIRAAALALKPGGHLVIDFMNANKVMAGLVKKEDKNVKGVDFHIERSVKAGVIRKKISFSCEGEEHCFEECVRALGTSDFERFFRNAGLKTLHLFGDYELGSFDEKNSPRLILIAQKA